MRRYLSNQCASGVALAIAATSFSPVALSQTESAVLEEVLVTARKREESLAETPSPLQRFLPRKLKRPTSRILLMFKRHRLVCSWKP